jgi:hypothetical protein
VIILEEYIATTTPTMDVTTIIPILMGATTTDTTTDNPFK